MSSSNKSFFRVEVPFVMGPEFFALSPEAIKIYLILMARAVETRRETLYQISSRWLAARSGLPYQRVTVGLQELAGCPYGKFARPLINLAPTDQQYTIKVEAMERNNPNFHWLPPPSAPYPGGDLSSVEEKRGDPPQAPPGADRGGGSTTPVNGVRDSLVPEDGSGSPPRRFADSPSGLGSEIAMGLSLVRRAGGMAVPEDSVDFPPEVNWVVEQLGGWPAVARAKDEAWRFDLNKRFKDLLSKALTEHLTAGRQAGTLEKKCEYRLVPDPTTGGMTKRPARVFSFGWAGKVEERELEIKRSGDTPVPRQKRTEDTGDKSVPATGPEGAR